MPKGLTYKEREMIADVQIAALRARIAELEADNKVKDKALELACEMLYDLGNCKTCPAEIENGTCVGTTIGSCYKNMADCFIEQAKAELEKAGDANEI